jgi:hypothetical protein
MKRYVFGIALLMATLAAQAQAAEVRVNVNIGAPPPIVLHQAPRTVYLAEPAVYAVVDTPYDLYLVGGRYYYSYRDNWFWSPRYSGPWTPVVYRSLPPGLQKFKVTKLREFRYRDDHGKSHGRGRGHDKH